MAVYGYDSFEDYEDRINSYECPYKSTVEGYYSAGDVMGGFEGDFITNTFEECSSAHVEPARVFFNADFRAERLQNVNAALYDSIIKMRMSPAKNKVPLLSISKEFWNESISRRENGVYLAIQKSEIGYFARPDRFRVKMNKYDNDYSEYTEDAL